jgi:hypothetical protein
MSQDVVNAMSDLKSNVSFRRDRSGSSGGGRASPSRGPSWESTGRQPTRPSWNQAFNRCVNGTLGAAGADVVGNPDNAQRVGQGAAACAIAATIQRAW